jgi:hypothetical protein
MTLPDSKDIEMAVVRGGLDVVGGITSVPIAEAIDSQAILEMQEHAEEMREGLAWH